MSADILIIDDELDIRSLIQGILEDEGYVTREAENDAKAYKSIKDKTPDLVILDIWLQGSQDDGLEILANIKEEHPLLPVVMISGHGTIETAVNAIKIGAYDFIEKPFKSDRLLLMIDRALENAKLRKENIRLKAKADGPSELIGESTSMNVLRQAMDSVARTNSRVLISGPAGVGKNLSARYIHNVSQRASGPFLTINCAILHPERLETELFGTSPDNNESGHYRQGMLEQANGGTLLLDEVADMPTETQGKIVRVLQEHKFQRSGSSEPVEIDVRIIASTNGDLQDAIANGKFREDLYYRLNVVPLEIPPLSERVQDIPLLIKYFIQSYSDQSGLPACEFSQEAIAILQSFDWPGNVRQLRNVIEWVMIMKGTAEDRTIKSAELPPDIINEPIQNGTNNAASSLNQALSLSLREAREEFEREYLLSQIKRFGGNISKTSKYVGMERSALHRKLKQLGLTALSKHDSTPDKDTNHDSTARRA